MLAGEQSFEPEGLILSWDANTEPDLAHYAVYRGAGEDFEPTATSRIATPTGAGYFDSEWRWDRNFCYKVTSVDIHGNESACAFLGPGEVAGGETPEIPRADFLDQNYPNPFNPATTISYGLAEPAHVTLRIYDAAGHLVRVLVEGPYQAGSYREVWDGTDTAGRPVASGIYFCRFDTGRYSNTGKMILLR